MSAELIREIMRTAQTKRLDGSGDYSAFVPAIAHVAYQIGTSADDARARLLASLRENIDRVQQAWTILGPRKF